MSNRNFYLTTKFGQRSCSQLRLAVIVAVVVVGFALVCLSFPSPSIILLFLTENLALKKPAEQSSRHNKSSGAENAVDGNRNPLFDANGNCSLTNERDPSWWRVDLGTNRVPVSDVLIVNRLFPPSARQTNGYYKITLGEE